MNNWLALSVEKFGVSANGWKLPFRLICSKPEEWINDFYKKVEFVVKR